jgi:hypothetical protein
VEDQGCGLVERVDVRHTHSRKGPFPHGRTLRPNVYWAAYGLVPPHTGAGSRAATRGDPRRPAATRGDPRAEDRRCSAVTWTGRRNAADERCIRTPRSSSTPGTASAAFLVTPRWRHAAIRRDAGGPHEEVPGVCRAR